MRNTPTKRRRLDETTNPLVYRDVLSLIIPHCTAQTFARLKRVCKQFNTWLPKEHPGIARICAGYAANPPVCYPEIVKLVFEAYYTKFTNELPREINKIIQRIRAGWIPALRSDKTLHPISVCEQTGIILDQLNVYGCIFWSRPVHLCNCADTRVHIGNMKDKIARQKFRLLLCQMKASF